MQSWDECRLIGFRATIYTLSRNIGDLSVVPDRSCLATIFNDQFEARSRLNSCCQIDTETKYRVQGPTGNDASVSIDRTVRVNWLSCGIVAS